MTVTTTADVKVQLETTMGSVQIPLRIPNLSYTISDIGIEGGIWDVGTAEEDFDIGDVGTEGLLLLYSLEDEGGGNVEWGPKSGGVMVPCGIIYPQRVALFDVNPTSVVIRAKSSAGTIKVLHWLLSQG